MDEADGTEPLFALIAVAVAAGALGRARGVPATVVVGTLSVLAGMPERWDRPWSEFPASLAVLASLAVAGHVVGTIEHRSRESGRRAEERSNRLQAVLSAVLHSDHRGIVVGDGEGRVVEANAAARRLLQPDPGEVDSEVLPERMLEWTVEDLIDPEEQVGVVLLDLDRFKAVNDVHGHAVGDQVLRQIGERIHAVCRPDDVAIRLGGDEFVLVLRRLASLADADVIVDRIAGAMRAPFTTDAGLIDVGCSLGATTGSALDAKRLVREADRLMYATKSAGQQDPGAGETSVAGVDRVRDRA